MPATLSLRQRLTRLMLTASGLALICVLATAFLFELTSFRPRVRSELKQKVDFLTLAEVLPATLGVSGFGDGAKISR